MIKHDRQADNRPVLAAPKADGPLQYVRKVSNHLTKKKKVAITNRAGEKHKTLSKGLRRFLGVRQRSVAEKQRHYEETPKLGNKIRYRETPGGRRRNIRDSEVIISTIATVASSQKKESIAQLSLNLHLRPSLLNIPRQRPGVSFRARACPKTLPNIRNTTT